MKLHRCVQIYETVPNGWTYVIYHRMRQGPVQNCKTGVKLALTIKQNEIL